MSAIVSAVATLVSGAVGWLGQFAKAVVGYAAGSGGGAATYTPSVLTLAVVAVPLVGLGVGLLKRLISTKV